MLLCRLTTLQIMVREDREDPTLPRRQPMHMQPGPGAFGGLPGGGGQVRHLRRSLARIALPAPAAAQLAHPRNKSLVAATAPS